jgi:ferredoxin
MADTRDLKSLGEKSPCGFDPRPGHTFFSLTPFQSCPTPRRVYFRNPMADKTRILKENLPGKWYVDDSCTPCHVCLEEAPKLLKYNEDQTYVYFFKQPESADELDAAQRALDICPTGSIGNDN